MILTEQIYYSVAGAADMVDKIRQFAIARGWTVDYWQPNSKWDSLSPFGWKVGNETHLQIWSGGYGNQNMCYRIKAYPSLTDPAESFLYIYAVYPGYRYHTLISTEPLNQNTFYSSSSYTNTTSVPFSTFDSLYLYGNEKFISFTLKLTAMSCIHFSMGTFNLFKSWENYTDGLFHTTPTGFTYTPSDLYKWYNIDVNPQNWFMPLAATANAIYFESVKDLFYCNYTPTTTVIIGAETGQFNKMMDFLWFNTFTNKRIAFHPTMFVKDPVGGTFYPAGLHPIAYVNGTNLSFGEQITFGTDTYKCYPGVNIPNPIWVAFRTA